MRPAGYLPLPDNCTLVTSYGFENYAFNSDQICMCVWMYVYVGMYVCVSVCMHVIDLRTDGIQSKHGQKTMLVRSWTWPIVSYFTKPSSCNHKK